MTGVHVCDKVVDNSHCLNYLVAIVHMLLQYLTNMYFGCINYLTTMYLGCNSYKKKHTAVAEMVCLKRQASTSHWFQKEKKMSGHIYSRR